MGRSKWRTGKYKSRLEAYVAALLKNPEYETDKLKYTVDHTYTPDFTIGTGKYIEAKGLFKAADRSKHLYIKTQHPDIQVFFVFGNPYNKLSKVSKTTYADWCDKHGFLWCDVKEFTREKIKEWKSTKPLKHPKEQ